MAYNFASIGSIISGVMDSDRIDIGREGTITLSDGSTSITDRSTPIYQNIPCHISYQQSDNPDPVTVGSMPVIISLVIHCAVRVDLQNGDYIYARKLSSTGEILESYEGVIGAPETHQSRKSAVLAVNKAV